MKRKTLSDLLSEDSSTKTKSDCKTFIKPQLSKDNIDTKKTYNVYKGVIDYLKSKNN